MVNWTNEEGSRFAPAMVSSGVFGGAFDKAWARSRKDRDGITFGDALDAIGYRGPQSCGEHPLSAFFELHIEQGPILEAEGKEIGVVTGVQGMRWYEATITGQDAHTGATPMHLRKNALLGAARMVEAIDGIARAHAPLAVGTVGHLVVKPNSTNVVPGEGFLRVDLRHPDGAVLDAMEKELYAAFDENSVCAGARRREVAHLRKPAGEVRCRLHRLGARRRRRPRVFRRATWCRAPATTRPTCRASRRPRWCSCRAAAASATTRRSSPPRSSAPRARRCCCRRCWISTGRLADQYAEGKPT